MFTVSRSALPETGFESLPRHKAVDNAVRITMDESRQSSMSISSDLFPELLSWSAFIDMTQRSDSASPPLPTQGMPNDIVEDDIFDDDDILTESDHHHRHRHHHHHHHRPPLSLSRIFDPTTLAMGFDVSHLDGLDEQLIYSPQDAFFELCWAHGVYSYDVSEDTISAPSLPSGSNPSSFIESDSTPEECHTQSEHHSPAAVRVQQFDGSPIKLSSYDLEKNPFVKDQVRDYLFNFDYPFNRDGSVGAFPVRPVVKQTKPPRGFTAFRPQWSLGRP